MHYLYPWFSVTAIINLTFIMFIVLALFNNYNYLGNKFTHTFLSLFEGYIHYNYINLETCDGIFTVLVIRLKILIYSMFSIRCDVWQWDSMTPTQTEIAFFLVWNSIHIFVIQLELDLKITVCGIIVNEVLINK